MDSAWEFRHCQNATIESRLASVIRETGDPPRWYEEWLQMGPEPTEQQRLALYQAVRDSHLLSEEAGFFLVSHQIDEIADRVVAVELHDMDERLTEIRQEYGLGYYEFWTLDEAPDEYRELLEVYLNAWDEIFARTLEEHGELEMARMFRQQRELFDRRVEAGRAYFFGPMPHTIPSRVVP